LRHGADPPLGEFFSSIALASLFSRYHPCYHPFPEAGKPPDRKRAMGRRQRISEKDSDRLNFPLTFPVGSAMMKKHYRPLSPENHRYAFKNNIKQDPCSLWRFSG
jgi:hypothetical protein